MNTYQDSCTKTDEVAKTKGLAKFTIGEQEVPAFIEPFQKHQINVCLNVVGFDMGKHMREIQNANE